MNNFDFRCPTRIIFGKGSIEKLKDLIPLDKKILMTYGGGSIKKNGVYDQVKEALKNHNVTEFGGIEPNPKYETLSKAIDIVKEKDIDFLLSVGGGSVLDGTKFIATAAKYKGMDDPYDAIMVKGEEIGDAIELASVMTLPATGSEMNCGGVISRIATNEKLAFGNPCAFPVFSIIDPEVTYTLPEKQVINGIIDTFVHTMEQYCTYDVNTPLQDYWALGILKTLIEEAPKVKENPKDYETRANIFWCATCGLNYWISPGVVQDWATHQIGHELTAFYGLDHGQSLAIVEPSLLRNQIEYKKGKLAKMGREIFKLDGTDERNLAEETIDRIEGFYNSIGMKTKLSDYGIDPKEAAQKIKERFEKRGTKIGEDQRIDANTVYDILINC